ncbi:hypothetical protein GOV12_00975 [Candidatus Pacearchaeota archaeon]|nr:hypothetical protein [Candidatus Pacearchaeota archaeon]
MKIDLKKLAKFLVKAKKKTYASVNRMKIDSERPLHEELEFLDENLYYRDSYVGFFQAPGMEEVRIGKDGKTIWTMAYSGGMLPLYQKDTDFSLQTFKFLKKAMSLVDEEAPYRGIGELKEDDWKYICKVKGDIKRFIGHEKIFFKGKVVFSQDFIGGLVLGR